MSPRDSVEVKGLRCTGRVSGVNLLHADIDTGHVVTFTLVGGSGSFGRREVQVTLSDSVVRDGREDFDLLSSTRQRHVKGTLLPDTYRNHYVSALLFALG